MVVHLEGFEAVCIAQTISRAALNGIEAIERARDADDDNANDGS